MTTLVDALSGTTTNASRVLEARYLRRDCDRNIIETPEQLYERVARAVSKGELLAGTARDAHRYEDDSSHRWLHVRSCQTARR